MIRDCIDEGGFNELRSRTGISPNSTVVFYGAETNSWAAYADVQPPASVAVHWLS